MERYTLFGCSKKIQAGTVDETDESNISSIFFSQRMINYLMYNCTGNSFRLKYRLCPRKSVLVFYTVT